MKCRKCAKWTDPRKLNRHALGKGQCQVTEEDIGGASKACEHFKEKK